MAIGSEFGMYLRSLAKTRRRGTAAPPTTKQQHLVRDINRMESNDSKLHKYADCADQRTESRDHDMRMRYPIVDDRQQREGVKVS